MIQMVMKSGDDEQVFDLAETPDFLLAQFFSSIIRHQDLRNPIVQNMLKEIADAFRMKANNNIKDGFACSVIVEQSDINYILETIDEVLKMAETSVPD